LNPITVPLEQARLLLFEGLPADFAVLAAYTGAALLVYGVGLWLFAILKKGFADVV